MTQHSRFGQDLWVVRQLGVSYRGYFVDVGPDHFKVGNNTYLLETLGWRGVCVEPNKTAAQLLRLSRQCQVEERALWSYSGAVELGGELVLTATLESILQKHRVTAVDYLSVNVPGAELEILGCFPWQVYPVKLVSVARKPVKSAVRALDALMVSAGFCHSFPCPNNPDEAYFQRKLV